MNPHSKAKQKRRRQGKRWASDYSGNRIIHAYKKKFNISLITAINDLEAIGVDLDEGEVAKIRLDRHHYGHQQLSKKKLETISAKI